jgi:hypothetical protein
MLGATSFGRTPLLRGIGLRGDSNCAQKHALPPQIVTPSRHFRMHTFAAILPAVGIVLRRALQLFTLAG